MLTALRLENLTTSELNFLINIIFLADKDNEITVLDYIGIVWPCIRYTLQNRASDCSGFSRFGWVAQFDM
jgi:hypothetical protein